MLLYWKTTMNKYRGRALKRRLKLLISRTESTDTKTKRCNSNPHFTGHGGLGVAASLAAARLDCHESEAQVDFATDLSEKIEDSWEK